MYTNIKVKNLDLAQWDWIQTTLNRTYRFAPGAPRVCVEFELTGQLDPVHVEMPVREFMLFLEELETKGQGEYPTFPIDAQEGHDHERPVHLTASAWPECPPVRTYADGCQGYGPYGEDDKTRRVREPNTPGLAEG